MVAVGMGQHHGDGLGSNLRHNLIQIRNNRSSINQDCAVVTLNKVERLIIAEVSVPYPCMFVELAEHHFVVLVNHFAAKVTTVDVCALSLYRKRHQAKQQGCKNHYFLHFSTQLERDGHGVQHAHQLATTHGWFPAGQRFDNAHGLVLQQSFSLLTHGVLVYLGVFAELLV